ELDEGVGVGEVPGAGLGMQFLGLHRVLRGDGVEVQGHQRLRARILARNHVRIHRGADEEGVGVHILERLWRRGGEGGGRGRQHRGGEDVEGVALVHGISVEGGCAGVGAAAGYHYLGSRPAATGTARGGTRQPRRSHANGIRAQRRSHGGGGAGGCARTYLGSPSSPTRSSTVAGSRPSDRATTRTVPDCPGTARTIASAIPLKALRSGEGKAVRSRGSPLSVATSVAGPSISKRTRLSALRMARPCASSTRRVMKDRSRPSLPIAVRSASSARRAGAPVVCTRAS